MGMAGSSQAEGEPSQEELGKRPATKYDVWAVGHLQHMLLLDVIECLVAVRNNDRARAREALQVALEHSDYLGDELDKLMAAGPK